MTTLSPPKCFECKYLHGDRTCEAFPDGIPDDIWWGENEHTKPYPEDNGFRFSPIEE